MNLNASTGTGNVLANLPASDGQVICIQRVVFGGSSGSQSGFQLKSANSEMPSVVK